MAVPCELWFFLVLIVHLTSINCSCHLLAVKAYNANKRRIRMWWLLLNSYTQMISLLQTHNNNCQIKQHDPWITMESNNSGKDLNFLAFALETGTCCCHEVHDDIILANYTEESDSYAFKGVAAFNEWRACSTWDAYTQQIYKLTRENNQNRLSPGWICFSLFLFSHSSVFCLANRCGLSLPFSFRHMFCEQFPHQLRRMDEYSWKYCYVSEEF